MFIPIGFKLPSTILSPFIKRMKVIACSGLTPRELVRTICIGVALGLLPLIWGTSVLCFWLAHRFRLNHLILQSINYLLYPLQLALLVPFCKLGLILIPWGPNLQPEMLLTISLTDLPRLPSLIFWLTIKALVAWLVTVPPLVLLAYMILRVTVIKWREEVFQLQQP